jgi:hypothetical protein
MILILSQINSSGDIMMSYQGTAYKYNQVSEIIVPTRTGTTYYGPRNHKPLVIYTGLNTDIEFFVKTTDRKSVNIDGKTFVATVVERDTNNVRLTKTLVNFDYERALLLLQINQDDSSSLTAGLYELVITYTDSESRVYGLHSDENNRISYVLEVKGNPLPTLRTSATLDNFVNNGSGSFYTSRTEGTAQSFNRDGINTCAVYLTNFTGDLYAQGTLDINPNESDWFTIQLDPESAENKYSFANESGVIPFSWDGMFMWVRFYYISDINNTGTVDKILYRN